MNRNEMIYTAILLLIHWGISSCARVEGQEVDDCAKQVQRLYLARIAEFDSAVRRLEAEGRILISDVSSLSQFRAQFLECRKRYKQCEALSEYFSPGAAKEINGVARDEVEENDPNQSVNRAEGLQVIESLTFPSFDVADSARLRVLLKNLRGTTIKLATLAKGSHFTNEQIFEAVRFEVVRIISLGITGFDALVAQTSIPEAKEATTSLSDILAIYSYRAPRDFLDLTNCIQTSCEYLITHCDFANFDRAEFIRSYLNPISIQIVKYQKVLGIPEYKFRRALRPGVSAIFDKGAFDASYYAPMVEDVSADLIELGKVLFFDPILSKNNRRACASCHKPEWAFTDGQAKSVALDLEGNVGRNSPTLVNAALQRAYFYDSRVSYLEDQVVAVMTNHKEFGCGPEEVVGKLTKSIEYRSLFEKAFPKAEDAISVSNVKFALASFVRSLTSLNSPFDKYMRGETKILPENVLKGFNLFAGKAKCATCHFVPLFNGTVPPYFDKNEFEIIGVLEQPDTVHGRIDPDPGRISIDRIAMNRHGFKTPTVRNIALTAPYMHNGAYKSLEDVLHFYNHGGGAGIGLVLPNQTLPSDKLNLTRQEMACIITFLNSLTDTSSVSLKPPKLLPKFPSPEVAARHIGGEY